MFQAPTTTNATSWRQVAVGAPVEPTSVVQTNAFGHGGAGSYPNHAFVTTTIVDFWTSTKSITSITKGRPPRRGAPPH